MSDYETLEGLVERITFANADNGYTVLRLTVRGKPDLVTVVGNLPEVAAGESLRLTGRWSSHTTYGKQFQAERCEKLLPASAEGIRRYLGSGLIKGIGPRMADRIVEKFGKQTLYVIDHEPHRLREVPDIGEKRYQLITAAWETQKAIKEVMVFLQGHGLSAGLAVKIYKRYGDAAIETVTTDPYRLARDIWGVGFKTADKIARALGLPPDAPTRLEAGVVFALAELADEGHAFAPEAELLPQAAELLGVPAEALPPAFDRLLAADRIYRDRVGGIEAVYLPPFFHAERGLAEQFQRLILTPATQLPLTPTHFSTDLASEQLTAVRMAFENKVSVITGGPGTGKTTCMKAFIDALDQTGRRYALASPTGRAAKRLAEATGREAKTIHRLLGFSPDGTYKFNEQNQLPLDVLVVDEASMLEMILAYHLLRAVPASAAVLLVGDVDQLPAVGAGNVLNDLIASERVPVARLTQIFRQAAGSGIITNAHRLMRGEMPLFSKAGEVGDFFLFDQSEEAEVAQWVVEVVTQRIPARFGFDPLKEVIVLSPMHRGEAGVAALNDRLQATLNPPAPGKLEKQLGGRMFRVGDRVMQLRNNYDLDVYNGDVGRVVAIDVEEQRLSVNYEGQMADYDWANTDEITHAYAASVHKAQGSEYPAVVLALLPRHYMLLQRNLLYTAITRAQKLCVIVGNRRAIGMAVQNDKVAQRWTGLKARLKEKG